MNIVYEGHTKSGKPLRIRCITAADSAAMLVYINQLSHEQTYVTMQGEQLTPAEEDEFVTDKIQAMAQRQAIMLLAWSGTELVGIGNVDAGQYAERHVGTLGISVAAGCRGDGIGRFLLTQLMQTASDYIDGLRMIRLLVFADNAPAITLYTAMGFVESGRLPDALFYQGRYCDQIEMYLPIN